MSDLINRVDMPVGQPFSINNAITSNHTADSPYLFPHRHDYFEVLWEKNKGSARHSHSIDFVEYALCPNRLFVISPRQIHESTRLNDDVQTLSFRPAYLPDDYRHHSLIDTIFGYSNRETPYIDTDIEGMKRLNTLYELMALEVTVAEPDWDLITYLLSSFLHYLARYAKAYSGKQDRQSERLMHLRKLIDQNFRHHHHTHFYASALSVTGKRLNVLARENTSKTVTQLLHDRIILEACRELLFTTKTVKTIGMELGFDDPAYFCRFFRRINDESPAHFRQRMTKKYHKIS